MFKKSVSANACSSLEDYDSPTLYLKTEFVNTHWLIYENQSLNYVKKNNFSLL